jgi:hypothetical protein
MSLDVSFVETRLFMAQREDYFDDGDFRALQNVLMRDPRRGDLVSGTGGLRKIRWFGQGRGKRGGVRVIYLRVHTTGVIYFLDIYAKNEQIDLRADERQRLRRVAQTILGEDDA